MIKAGSLVRFRGSIGLVWGPCKKRWAKPDDVWVMWTNEPKPRIESCRLLEVLSASR